MQSNLVSIPEDTAQPSRPAVFPYGRIESSSRWPATPGTQDCPDCGSSIVGVQGLRDCPDCAWTSHGD